MKLTNYISLGLKGFAMGIAEAIPGVSGGTFAFITGIYEELIDTIKSITPNNLLKVKEGFGELWSAINGKFLLNLGIGMALGVGIGATIISHLLDTEKETLWALFFGIVLASTIFLGRKVTWNSSTIAFLVVGAIFSYYITILTPAAGSDNLLYLFFAGCIAVSALMLPGISGSFILLLMGLYHTVIHSLKEVLSLDIGNNLIVLIVFGLGVLTGLFTFARVISFLFNKYYNLTMAAMIGVLIGSLNKLWPWKFIETALDKSNNTEVAINNTVLPNPENYKILKEVNISPEHYATYTDPKLVFAISAIAVGMMIVWALAKYDKN